MEFTYIRNKIRKYKRDSILEKCYSFLYNSDFGSKKTAPIWDVFTLMKWTYLYSQTNYQVKNIQDREFGKLLNYIHQLQDEYLEHLTKKNKWDKIFLIFHTQQFYLQKDINKLTYARQLKLYSTLTHKYDINRVFKEKTGLSLEDIIFCNFTTWLYINVKTLSPDSKVKFYGYLGYDFIKVIGDFIGLEKLLHYIKLLTLNPLNEVEKINDYKRGLRNHNLQPFEISFFTLYPFQYFQDAVRLTHTGIFNHTVDHFIYDYLKSNDDSFTEEFGKRFEKYIELGLIEAELNYITENDLKKQIGKDNKVVDYLINNNILIECKAVELQAYPSVNPLDELLYNSLKDSIIKAYTKQMLGVASNLNNSDEYWGIIVTYKELYFGNGNSLWDILKEDTEHFCSINNFPIEKFPPSNLYIMDINTWDWLVHLLKEKSISLIEILKNARTNDAEHHTRKLLFSMHLKDYGLKEINLEYLKDENAIINNLFKEKANP